MPNGLAGELAEQLEIHIAELITEILTIFQKGA